MKHYLLTQLQKDFSSNTCSWLHLSSSRDAGRRICSQQERSLPSFETTQIQTQSLIELLLQRESWLDLLHFHQNTFLCMCRYVHLLCSSHGSSFHEWVSQSCLYNIIENKTVVLSHCLSKDLLTKSLHDCTHKYFY